MKRGLDTSVLVYAHIPAFPEHEPIRRFLHGQLATEEVTLVVTPGILHEFVHVVTDARRFEPPLTMAEALAVARLYLGRSNVECAETDEAAVSRALDLIERHGLGRKRLADALLAATLMNHAVGELITCDPHGFAPFDGLRVTDPRAR